MPAEPTIHGTSREFTLHTPRQTAARLCISTRKLWAETAAGRITAVRIGRSVRYDIRDIEAYIQRNRTGGTR